MNTRSRQLLDKLKYQPLKKTEMEELEILAKQDASVESELEFIKLVEAAVIHKSTSDLRQKMSSWEGGYRVADASISPAHAYTGNTSNKHFHMLRIAAIVTGVLLLAGSIILVMQQNDNEEQLAQEGTQEKLSIPEIHSKDTPVDPPGSFQSDLSAESNVKPELAAKQIEDSEKLLLKGTVELEDGGFGFAKNDFSNIKGFKIYALKNQQDASYRISQDTLIVSMPESKIQDTSVKLVYMEGTNQWSAGTYLFIGNEGYLLMANGLMKATKATLEE